MHRRNRLCMPPARGVMHDAIGILGSLQPCWAVLNVTIGRLYSSAGSLCSISRSAIQKLDLNIRDCYM